MLQPMKYPNFSVKNYLNDIQLQFNTHDTGEHNELAINCPSCVDNGEPRPDTKKRLWINGKTGDFYCYNCSWAGQLPKLVCALSHTTLLGALRIMKGKTGNLEILSYRLSNEVDFTFKELESEEIGNLPEVEFPHGFELFSENRDAKTIFHKYLRKRGIDLDYACEQEWGYSKRGYTANRLIVPTYMNKRLVMWQARDILEKKHQLWGTKEYRKVLNPKGVSKSKVLYNFDKAKEFEEIVVVEGFIDAAKVGDNAVAINGKSLHAAQLEAFTQTKAKSIVLLLDPDAFEDEKRYANGPKKGRLRKPSSVEKARSMLSVLFDVRTVKLPDGRDAGSYDHDELQSIINAGVRKRA